MKVVGNDLKLAYSFAQAVDILLASVARRLSAFVRYNNILEVAG